MAARHTTVGVIGLGSMGLGVAKTLCRAGFETWGFDVRDAAVLEFEEAGGHAASSPAALGQKVDIAIVLVATADQVRTVLFGEAGAADAVIGCDAQTGTRIPQRRESVLRCPGVATHEIDVIGLLEIFE